MQMFLHLVRHVGISCGHPRLTPSKTMIFISSISWTGDTLDVSPTVVVVVVVFCCSVDY